MLIRFAVENHLSIRDRQELSMVAAGLQDKGVDLITVNNVKLVPAALIYGANASGKSNFLSALSLLSGAVESSHAQTKPNSKIPRSPFLLDEKSKSSPTKIDLDFFLNEVRFHYGFVATNDAFIEEWLYAFPSGKKQVWFYRDATKRSIHFGKNLKGSLKTIEGLTRPNSLFLSAAAQNAHKQLTEIFDYLSSFSFKYRIENESQHAVAAFAKGAIDGRIIRFLQQADTGVVSHQFREMISDSKIDRKSFMNDVVNLFKKYSPEAQGFPPDWDDVELKKISLGHRTGTKRPKFFDLRLESAGTLRLLVLLKTIFQALDQGSLVVIDELELHPVLLTPA